jgi:TctA family transporter
MMSIQLDIVLRDTSMVNMRFKEILKVTGLPVLFASLCCLSPLILVLFGLATASFASSLADVLYGEYKWVFRAVGLLLLLTSAIIYFRTQKGICTIDEAKKRRREIINSLLLFSIAGVLGYVFFLYVIVHYAGVFLGIWADYY